MERDKIVSLFTKGLVTNIAERRLSEDRILKRWTTEAGYPAIVLTIRGGEYNNGYVGVPPKHILYQVDYTERSQALGLEESSSPECEISVHGGVTYSGYHASISPSGPYNTWWFGFDCAHCGDLIRNPFFSNRGGIGATFKDESYVSTECEKLAIQLKIIDESIIDSFLTGIEKEEV